MCYLRDTWMSSSHVEYRSILTLSYNSTKAGGVMRSFVMSVILSLSRIAHKSVDRCQPNMVGMDKGWPSRSDLFLALFCIQKWIGLSLSLTLTDNVTVIHKGGNAVMALSDTAFYTTYIQSPHDDNATALAAFALFECSCFQLNKIFPNV